MDDNLEKLCWELYLEYEKDLKLHSPTSAMAYFDNDEQDEYEEENAILACIESKQKCHEFSGPLKLKKVRQSPPQLNLNVTVPIQLPANLTPSTLPADIQHILQQLQQNVANQVGQTIATQLKAKMPVVAVDIQNDKMMWKESDN